MKQLLVMDFQDYNKNHPHSKRPSVRAVIRKGSKLAMVYSCKYKYYKFPGGGIEKDEDHISALIREVAEETGLKVKPETVKEYGLVTVLKKSDLFEDHVFEQESFYYICDTEETVLEQSLDDYESDAEFSLRYVYPHEAIAANKVSIEENKVMLLRENKVLELLDK